jgi:hypothetical protein
MFKTSKRFKNLVLLSTGLAFAVMAFVSTVMITPSHVYAADDTAAKDHTCKAGEKPDPANPCVPSADDVKNTPDAAAKTCSGNDCSGLISKYINPFIKLLSGLVGILVTMGFATGGVQIASAGGDPSKVVAGRKRITNAIIALLAYLFLFAFLQWLLPGGIV